MTYLLPSSISQKIIILLICLVINLGTAYAGIASDVCKTALSARTLALGGGLSVQADALPLENPVAALGNNGRIFLQNTTLVSDVQQTIFAYVLPNAGCDDQWGMTVVMLGMNGLESSALDATGRVDFSSGSAFNYGSETVALSYARTLENGIRIGSNFKYYAQSLDGYGTATGYSWDLGYAIAINSQTAISVLHRNLFSGNNLVWSNGHADTLESFTQFNLSHHADLIAGQPVNLTIGCDVESNGAPVHAGIEYMIQKELALRYGLDQSVNSHNGGTQISTLVTMGLGLKVDNYDFDYAFYPTDGTSELWSHIFSFSYRF